MSFLSDALEGVGVDIANGVQSLGQSISEFNNQNLSPDQILKFASSIPETVSGIPGIGSRIPGLGKIPLPTAQLPSILSAPNLFKLGSHSEWEALHYANDLNAHQPKFKFLFKVGFYGFGTREFYYFVHRCERPKVRFNHQEVNYYNFRSKVLTSVTFDPLNLTFLDEIGNSVNSFFVNYLKTTSGQGDGYYGIDTGFGNSTSSKPYSNGASVGKAIIIEQIFANGTLSNRYKFANPRIESFDLEDLSMNDNDGSMVSLSFSYDALSCETVESNTIYSWGQTDLLRGGGTSGIENAGASSVDENAIPRVSANNGSIGGFSSFITKQPDQNYSDSQAGYDILSQVPGSLQDFIDPIYKNSTIGGFPVNVFNQSGKVTSSGTIISKDIQETLTSITSGTNLVFGGKSEPSTIDNVLNQDGIEIT